MAQTLSRNPPPSSSTLANKKSTSANKQSTVHKTRSLRSTRLGRENQFIGGEEVSVPVRAVEEPESVTKRVSKQTVRSGGKRHKPQSSDDDESVSRPVKHTRSAKNARSNKSSPAQETLSTHSMSRRSKLVNG